MDFDGDNEKDLITGCFEGGLYLIQGLGDGEFATPTPVLDKADNILRLGQYWDDENREWTGVEDSEFKEYLGICGYAVDFDDDGDLDLVLGSNEGYLFWRENEGSRSNPQYATESIQLKSGDEPLVTGSHAMPFVIDWNGDGLFDILSGRSDGGVVWFKNIGQKAEPAFEPAAELIEAGRQSADGKMTVGRRSQVTVGDVNGDGLLDILVGDYNYLPPDMSTVSDEDQARIKELTNESTVVRREMMKLQKKLEEMDQESGEAENEESRDALVAEIESLNENYAKMVKERQALMPKRTMHGYVWKFVQKPSDHQ